MFEVTNNDRASWANTALSAFAVECYAPGAEEDETIMRDLLTDFRHLADAQGWDIESMWAGSRLTYIEEVAEDGGPATADFADPDRDEPSDEQARIYQCQSDGWTFDYQPSGWYAYKGNQSEPTALVGPFLSIHGAAIAARIDHLEAERDSYVLGHPNGHEEPNPEGWATDNPEDAEELDSLYAERAEAGK